MIVKLVLIVFALACLSTVAAAQDTTTPSVLPLPEDIEPTEQISLVRTRLSTPEGIDSDYGLQLFRLPYSDGTASISATWAEDPPEEPADDTDSAVPLVLDIPFPADLVLVNEDGVIVDWDLERELSNARDFGGTDYGVFVVPAGNWMALIMADLRDQDRELVIETHGIGPAEPIALSSLPKETLDGALQVLGFITNDVRDEYRRMNAVSHQLRNPEMRRVLRRALWRAQQILPHAIDKARSLRDRVLKDIGPDYEGLLADRERLHAAGPVSDAVLSIIDDELSGYESRIGEAEDQVSYLIDTTELVTRSLDALVDIDKVQSAHDALEATGPVDDTLTTLRAYIDTQAAQREELDFLLNDLAQIILSSDIKLEGRAGGKIFGVLPEYVVQFRDLDEIFEDLLYGPTIPVIEEESGGVLGMYVDPSWDPGAWGDTAYLTEDEILRASARAIMDRALLEDQAQNVVGKPKPETLADVAQIMASALNDEGFAQLAYLGLEGQGDAFVLITGLEQTDAQANPLASQRFSSRIAKIKSRGIAGYLRALFTAEPGYFRVIGFVVSPSELSNSGPEGRLETLRQWNDMGFKGLPREVAAQAFTTDHDITVLVYEFEKDSDLQPARVVDPANHPVRSHFDDTKRIHDYIRG